MATVSVSRSAGRKRPALRLDILVLGLAVALLAYLALVPLGMLMLGAVSESGTLFEGGVTLRHFQRVITDPSALELLSASFLYSAGAALLAFAIGTAMAWVVERSDVPVRNLWYGLALVPLIIPGIVHTIGWVFLLSPEIGWINAPLKALFGFSLPVYSLPGMIWVQGLHDAPFAFVLMGAALRTMDPSLEEAAAAARANPWQTLRRISLPLLLPASAGVLLILFVRTLESFEVPAIIGLPGRVFVYTSRIYLSLNQYPPNFGLAAAFATTLLGISVIALAVHRRLTRRSEAYATVTGKAYRPRRVELGRWRSVAIAVLVVYALGGVFLPIIVLLYSSFLRVYVVPSPESLGTLTLNNYAFILTDDTTLRALGNSALLGVTTATVVVLFTAVIAWLTVRSKTPGRGILDFVAFVPIAIPGIVLGISLIWVYFTVPIRIYGTLWILLVAYVTRFMPYGMRSLSAGLIQIHRELEEAAQAAGARWWPTFRRITLPLLRPVLLATWIYVFIISLRELSSGILLYSSQSVVLAIRIFDLREAGQYTAIAALSIILIVSLVVLVAVLQRFGGRVVSES